MNVHRHSFRVGGLCLISLASLLGDLSTPAKAADLTKIDRSIAKEPPYQTKAPKYCLLVFGPEARYRVWLVLDGDTLYVDRNGNGDLTEPGKSTKVESSNSDPASFSPITIFGPDGKTEEKLNFALYGWFDYRDGKNKPQVSPAVSVWWKGRWFGSWGDETGPCAWGARPKDAPILHIDGPLQMGFEIPAESALQWKRDGQIELSVGVGTKGLGKGAFVHLSYANNAIPEDAYPSAVLEFPNKSPGGPPIQIQTVLKHRC
jgi:hypothetical protein